MGKALMSAAGNINKLKDRKKDSIKSPEEQRAKLQEIIMNVFPYDDEPRRRPQAKPRQTPGWGDWVQNTPPKAHRPPYPERVAQINPIGQKPRDNPAQINPIGQKPR